MNLGTAWQAVSEGQPITGRPHGNSMIPIVNSGDLVKIEPVGDARPGGPRVGDIALAKVKGSLYLHLITRIGDDGRFMISNNKGHDNGWSRDVRGIVTEINGRNRDDRGR